MIKPCRRLIGRAFFNEQSMSTSRASKLVNCIFSYLFSIINDNQFKFLQIPHYSRTLIIRHSINRPFGLSDLPHWAKHFALSDQNGKNQYQEWFFDNSGNGFGKSDTGNSYICTLDQHSIAFSSQVIWLKSTQNFGHVKH